MKRLLRSLLLVVAILAYAAPVFAGWGVPYVGAPIAEWFDPGDGPILFPWFPHAEEASTMPGGDLETVLGAPEARRDDLMRRLWVFEALGF